jgi:hypothetical protein
LGALVYADWRVLVNDARRVLRSPGRLALWALYAVGFICLMATRADIGRRHHSAPPGRVLQQAVTPGGADTLRADYFMCVLLVVLAVALVSGAGAIGIFRSRAEARFVIGSPVAAPLAIAYLQARESLSQGTRILVSFLYFIFVFGPRQLGPIAVAADLVFVIAMIGAAAAVVVPRRLLPPPAGIICAVVGVPLGLLALAPAVRDAVTQSPLPLPAIFTQVAAAIPAWHPGYVLLDPQPQPLLIVLGVAATAIAILASSGRDAYPELYALSIARMDHSERRQLRWTSNAATPKATPAKAVRDRVRSVPGPPAGVLVIVWKSVVEFRRGTTRGLVIGGAIAWCIAGFSLAHVDASVGASVIFTGIANVLIFSGLAATSTLAAEIRRPLFWLAPSPLFDRLCALAVGRTWRTVFTLELSAVGFAAGGGGLNATLALAVAFPVLALLQTGAGFAVFALFPSAGDARGPAMMLRLIVAFVMLAPPLVAFGIVVLGFGVPITAGIGAAVVIAFVEAGALVGLAAWRLDGHVDRLPG